ncbi:MAG: class IV adenylate cyclase [Anaerolineales bacterium]|nr:class IV adenylate cyclase [Anaerolineales bacterium]MDW8226463.1 class IV adenylate cyclase [Anaerolineales bacterium]
MARNIEIKARVADLSALQTRAQAISNKGAQVLQQEDVFFHVEHGRLKLRKQTPGPNQLVYYERPDQSGPKQSFYLLATVQDTDGLEQVLTAALGVRGVVRKRRTLYWVGQTRIHLDEVEGLGTFLELEVMLEETQKEEEGVEIAKNLMKQLGVREEDLLEGAYLDLAK